MSHDELLKQNLEEIAAQVVPAVNLKQRIEARVNPGQATRARFRLSPLVLVGLVLFPVLAVTATVYATGSGFRQLFQMDPRLQNVDPTQMGQQLNLSQTQNEVTVHLDWAYVDRDRVLVWYSLNAGGGKRFDPKGLQLEDDSGNVYPFDFGYGVTGHSDLIGVDLPAGQGSYVVAFTLPAGKQAGQQLTLTFRMEAVELIIQTKDAPQPTQGGANSPATVVLEPLPVGKQAGPFEFHFNVQINP
jgi:hypothetical protein